MKKALQKYKNIQDIDLDAIYDFIDNGDRSRAPQEVVDYLDLMDKIRAMHLRIDRYGSKDAIVNHLMKVEGLSRYLANKAYNQSMEYFYADNDISKEAWRNILAQRMEKNIALAQQLVKDVADSSKVNKMYIEMAQALGLHLPDPEPVPEGAYDKPYKIYTLSMEDLGKVPLPKRELRDFIMKLPEVSEKVKLMACQEAGLEDHYVIFPEENEDPRKS
ncbi:hypothetical protein VS868_11955 [Salinimicrobium sp. 3283s]|uniref:hypothetical protein n=1 Tax=Salinimicrobium sp. 3283s TaxID=3114359 RepID=UPI0031E7DCFD